MTEWLNQDDAETKLWQAIKSITLGNKTDDKLILAALKEQGIWLAKFDGVGSQARLSEAVKILKMVSDTSHRARDRKHYRFPVAVMERVDSLLATEDEVGK